MTGITIGDCRYRLVAAERDGRWIAHAVREDTGQRFGIDRAGPTRDDAFGRLTEWLTWQSDHSAAIEALQTAERAYHRAVAGSAFANPTEAPNALERQKQFLAAVEGARVSLDKVRARQPR
ncbi:MAG: hypothetical protein ABI868_16845 [Acidobacteriota bacterium]